MHLLTTFVICLLIVINDQLPFGQRMAKYPLSIPIMVISFLFSLFTVALFMMHSFLVFRNMTTYELCKKNWDVVSGNPYSKDNCFKHILKLFIKLPKNSMIVDEELVPRSEVRLAIDQKGVNDING
jgi:hypothetical protein